MPSPLLGKEYPASTRHQFRSIHLTRDGSIYLTAIVKRTSKSVLTASKGIALTAPEAVQDGSIATAFIGGSVNPPERSDSACSAFCA